MPFKPLEQEPTTKDDLGVDREDAVERLNALKQFIGYDKDSEIVKATQKSLDMAIASLKADEAYNLMYEGVEVFTKEEVATMFTELKSEIEKQSWRLEALSEGMDGKAVDLDDIEVLFQKKFNVLRGETDGRI